MGGEYLVSPSGIERFLRGGNRRLGRRCLLRRARLRGRLMEEIGNRRTGCKATSPSEISINRFIRGSYKAHSFSNNKHESLVCNSGGVCQEEEGKSDVEKREGGDNRCC